MQLGLPQLGEVALDEGEVTLQLRVVLPELWPAKRLAGGTKPDLNLTRLRSPCHH
jgi:hypothetical protein